MSAAPAIEVNDLVFRYGDRTALDKISFSVERGEIFGLLGPNGGGKTTLFRILSTLLSPAAGSAKVAGFNVSEQPLDVRKSIGVVFQNQSLDRRLTALENLIHQGHLYGLRGAALDARIDSLLQRLGLEDRRNDAVDTLSGGLKRRVELAKGLIHNPAVLLLDEPSTGVDPGARLDFWEYLQLLRRHEGITVLLTTHLLEEADKCDRLAILDKGSLVAEGTPRGLKQQIGGDVVVILTSRDSNKLSGEISQQFELEPTIVNGSVRFEHPKGAELVARLMQALPDQIDSVTVSHPTLEDVFIHMTGRRFGEGEQAGDQP
jgi:ABC-2 type transport system ATP-binding protein